MWKHFVNIILFLCKVLCKVTWLLLSVAFALLIQKFLKIQAAWKKNQDHFLKILRKTVFYFWKTGNSQQSSSTIQVRVQR